MFFDPPSVLFGIAIGAFLTSLALLRHYLAMKPEKEQET
jgi:hypothetical protein